MSETRSETRCEPREKSSALIDGALDPARSVVVEACAGSGKTWLLASRIIRLLLAGVAPGEILAITFTRKAAREIEERVVNWLKLLATASDGEVAGFLAERGLAADAELIRRARGLYETVLLAQPPLAVNTFHGWFLQLVAAAPLSADLAGAALVDADSRLFDELWQGFAGALQKTPESRAATAFIELLDEPGLDATRRLLRRTLARRSEWLAFGHGRGVLAAAIADEVTTSLCRLFEARDGGSRRVVGQALADFFAGEWARSAGEFQAYLGLLETSALKTDLDCAARLRLALAEIEGAREGANERAFALLRGVFLTKENTLRSRNAGAALDRRLGAAGAVRFLDLHARLGLRLLACIEKQLEERIVAFNENACLVFAAFLAYVEDFKQARRQIDFVDAEWRVLQLLRDEASAAFMQSRLDSRYRQLLVDEFQDTNPLQWQVLTAWLGAYAYAADATRPSVFIVGDPKQSIYRFRRAEPKLFTVAAEFLEREYAALRCEQDVTRRNAQPIVDVVNAIFAGRAEFTPFREQHSLAGALPGRVEVLPLCSKGECDDDAAGASGASAGDDPRQLQDAAPRASLRDPLHEAESEVLDLRLASEAEQLAAKIREIVGASGDAGASASAWQIDERDASGALRRRGARYGDILLLVRTRSHLACYERALSAAQIPFAAASRGGLLGALEVRDIVALLEFLVIPLADLALAQALRSPLFACSDEDLLALAAGSASSWWQRLQRLVAGGAASNRLKRAERLLRDWLQAADRLPAHDLLDRIYAQGEVAERYRQAVPGAAAASVEANLRALILLALDVDGGRYPSLPRFIDELRDLREAEANDAPDEGEIESLEADAGRVRILTIHSAKGLEAPIVWLLGANSSPRPPDPWDLIVDWPPAAEAPTHLSFFGRKEDRGAARQAVFEAEAAAARREELNLLYVALTRAKQVFIASGIETGKSPKGGAKSARRDEAASVETAYRLLARGLERLGAALAYGDAMPVGAIERKHSERAAALPLTPLPPTGERRNDRGDGGNGAERNANPENSRFGILLHALLERRTLEFQGAIGEFWWRRLGFDDAEYQRALPVAERMLGAPPLQRFFVAANYRRAWNEVELAGEGGGVQRIDRLVDAGDAVWVLDYKSSYSDSDRLFEYRQQVDAYCRAVAAIFPGRPVRGALLFADAALVEVVAAGAT